MAADINSDFIRGPLLARMSLIIISHSFLCPVLQHNIQVIAGLWWGSKYLVVC